MLFGPWIRRDGAPCGTSTLTGRPFFQRGCGGYTVQASRGVACLNWQNAAGVGGGVHGDGAGGGGTGAGGGRPIRTARVIVDMDFMRRPVAQRADAHADLVKPRLIDPAIGAW